MNSIPLSLLSYSFSRHAHPNNHTHAHDVMRVSHTYIVTLCKNFPPVTFCPLSSKCNEATLSCVAQGLFFKGRWVRHFKTPGSTCNIRRFLLQHLVLLPATPNAFQHIQFYLCAQLLLYLWSILKNFVKI